MMHLGGGAVRLRSEPITLQRAGEPSVRTEMVAESLKTVSLTLSIAL